jgi:hypothetical protein
VSAYDPAETPEGEGGEGERNMDATPPVEEGGEHGKTTEPAPPDDAGVSSDE